MPSCAHIPDLPSDIELEQAVIGACIVKNQDIPSVQSTCAPSDFFHNPHPRIVEAIFALSDSGKQVSPLSIRAAINNCDGVPGAAEFDWLSYLTNMALSAPVKSAASIASLIADLRQRRDGVVALTESLEAIQNRTIPIVEALQAAQSAADVASEKRSRATDMSIQEASHAFCAKIQDVIDGKPVQTVKTGVEKLDYILGGLQAGDFAIYDGRPGSGKTCALVKTGYAAALQGRPSLLFELEMTREQLLARLGCAIDYESHHDDPLSYTWFRRGDVQAYQLERMAVALRKIPDNFRIFDRSGMTIHEIAALARGCAKREKKMGLVVIDYLQIIKPGERYAGNKVQEITEISNACKQLAKSIGWPVLVGCQLSRGVEQREDKRPVLSDLRESGSLEQDADQVVGLYRPAYYLDNKKPDATDPQYGTWCDEYETVKNRLDLLVLKNRHGEAKIVNVFCDMRASVIRDEKP